MINVIEDLSCIPGAGLSCNIKDFGLDRVEKVAVEENVELVEIVEVVDEFL